MMNIPAPVAQSDARSLTPLSVVLAPPRRPKRSSEEADPTDLPPDEFQEPAEEPAPSPDPDFDEPSTDNDDEFPEPAT